MVKEERGKKYFDINRNNDFKFEEYIFVNLLRYVEK